MPLLAWEGYNDKIWFRQSLHTLCQPLKFQKHTVTRLIQPQEGSGGNPHCQVEDT